MKIKNLRCHRCALIFSPNMMMSLTFPTSNFALRKMLSVLHIDWFFDNLLDTIWSYYGYICFLIYNLVIHMHSTLKVGGGGGAVRGHATHLQVFLILFFLLCFFLLGVPSNRHLMVLHTVLHSQFMFIGRICLMSHDLYKPKRLYRMFRKKLTPRIFDILASSIPGQKVLYRSLSVTICEGCNAVEWL